MKTKKNLTRKEILALLQKNQSMLNKCKVKKIGLFGSYALGKQRKKSDLDFLVVFKELKFDNYIELKFLLEKIFHKKVDLVIEEDLKPALKYVKEEALYAKGL